MVFENGQFPEVGHYFFFVFRGINCFIMNFLSVRNITECLIILLENPFLISIRFKIYRFENKEKNFINILLKDLKKKPHSENSY